MKIKKTQAKRALKFAMREHKWAPGMKRIFNKSFDYYLKSVIEVDEYKVLNNLTSKDK